MMNAQDRLFVNSRIDEAMNAMRTALYEANANNLAMYLVFIDKGLIKGGSLHNAVVIKDDVAFSKEGLFFPDEMVRHKILDLIGDLSLIGIPFCAHVIAIRAGHAANAAFGRKLLSQINMERNGCPL